MLRRLALVPVIASALLIAGEGEASHGATIRVSTRPDGTDANNSSRVPISSNDGRFIAFQSLASDIVSGDTNVFCSTGNCVDVFVYDRQTSATERVSVDSGGAQAMGQSVLGGLSADGRYVVFSSLAPNLVSNDTNGYTDAFIKDRMTGITERVSVSISGGQATGNDSYGSDLSPDGRFVVFSSGASNLVSGDVGGNYDTFLRDRQTGTTEMIGVDSNGNQANYGSGGGPISDDGRFVAFSSVSTNLVPNLPQQTYSRIYMRDRQLGITSLVSVNNLGQIGNGSSYAYDMSTDARFIAFTSDSTNLVFGDTNGAIDIFVRDLLTGRVSRVSVSSSGQQGNNSSGHGRGGGGCLDMSRDGRFIAFCSLATNLVPADNNVFCNNDYSGQYDDNCSDVFVHDRLTGITARASLSNADLEGNGQSEETALAANGRSVSFASYASNLVASDANYCNVGGEFLNGGHCPDIFVRDFADSDADGAWDPFDTCPTSSDCDADSVSDGMDNCPNWPNPTQTLPPWSLAAGDPDCDGFSSPVENVVGTSPLSHCGNNAWPPDINNDGLVDMIGDIVPIVGQFAQGVPPAPGRYDMAPDPPDRLIDIFDIVRMAGFFAQHC